MRLFWLKILFQSWNGYILNTHKIDPSVAHLHAVIVKSAALLFRTLAKTLHSFLGSHFILMSIFKAELTQNNIQISNQINIAKLVQSIIFHKMNIYGTLHAQ